jgi:hypothetical protein
MHFEAHWQGPSNGYTILVLFCGHIKLYRDANVLICSGKAEYMLERRMYL